MKAFHNHFRGSRDQDDHRETRHRDGRHGGFKEFEGERQSLRGGRGGPGRLFGAGDLRFVILQLIAEKPSYGYEIIKSIQERIGGGYAPSPGVVYPMLTMLEEMGHATVVPEGARRLYTISEEGTAALLENKATVDAIFARIERVRGEQTSEETQQIERAIANFRMVLRGRMASRAGKLTTEQIHAITDIIDAAAKQIERLG